jgi:hypothetical protein
VVTTDISDHLPIFNFIERQPAQKSENKFVKYRKLNDNVIQRIIRFLDSIDWINILKDLNVNDASNYFIEKITDALDTFAPEKTIKIKPENIIRQPWMTPGLLALSRTKDKMYRKCIGKSKQCKSYMDFINHRNMYNRMKKLVNMHILLINYWSTKIT